MRRDLFSDLGGYDERFAGWYGSDRDFRNRIGARARTICLRQHLIRVTPEAISDAWTTNCTRMTPEDEAALARLKAERDASDDPRPIRQNFPYERVF